MTQVPPLPPPKGLLALLALANFVIGMGAFVVVGILTPFAADMGITATTAGWLMTAYALVYAVASPPLVALTGGLDRKTVLLAGLTLFGIGAAAAALSPSFVWVMASRAIMAVGGGLVTPVCASVAVGLTPPADRGRALATVFGGLTLAQVLGVPVGAWLGYQLGWQATFVTVAALCAVVWAAFALLVPRNIAVPRASLAALGQVLSSGWRMGAVAFTVLFLSGTYSVYTYFAALMEARLGLGRDGVSLMLAIFGAGAVLGNLAGGRMADRIGSNQTLLVLCCAQMVLLPLLSWAPLPFAPMAILVTVWSVFTWSFMAPQQARLAGLDAPRTPILFALNASAIYVGASVGTLAGGLVLDQTGGFGALGLVGAAFMLAAGWSIWAVARAVVTR
jgi:MFS transporter, DHA1 family, inner membrane transport protein